MNYLEIPNSKLKLVDGNIVMLERFPGLKWVLHDGWYRYNGRQYQGWYFMSIPSQTILPVSDQDLRMLTLISSKSNDAYPDYPAPPPPPGLGPCPGPEPYPYPCPDEHHHHHHPDDCPGGLYPPVPPMPEPGRPAFFSQRLKKQLEEAFISVPSIKKRDQLETSKIPDGKIVRVNNVNGEPKYYIWSAFNDHWEDFELLSLDEIEAILQDYYTAEEVDQYLADISSRIDDTNSHVDELAEQVTEVSETVSVIQEETQLIDNRLTTVEESYVPNTIEIVAGPGLIGGGTLADNVTIEHADSGTGSSETYQGSKETEVISSIEADEFGHVMSATTTDLETAITNIVHTTIDEDDTIARISDIPTWTVVA